jgi:hypothetical protein
MTKGDRAPDILALLSRPLVGPFAHIGRRCDRVDGNHLIGAVGHIGGGLIAIHDFRFMCHLFTPFLDKDGDF